MNFGYYNENNFYLLYCSSNSTNFDLPLYNSGIFRLRTHAGLETSIRAICLFTPYKCLICLSECYWAYSGTFAAWLTR